MMNYRNICQRMSKYLIHHVMICHRKSAMREGEARRGKSNDVVHSEFHLIAEQHNVVVILYTVLYNYVFNKKTSHQSFFLNPAYSVIHSHVM